MELNWKSGVRGDSAPELVDTTTSKKNVYLRKNVHEVQVPNMEGEGTSTAFEYDEAVLSKDEYVRYLAEQENEDRFTNMELALAELAEAMVG